MSTAVENGNTWFSLLLKAAENGRLPDSIVRLGMRRLLAKRARECRVTNVEQTRNDFITAAIKEPIAVTPEKANDQHYELPAEFFSTVLGTHLKYSCCYWDEGVHRLATAEAAALRQTCEHAELRDGMRVLELGCGWGSLTLWMAANYPASQITAVSNSHSQRKYIETQAQIRGHTNITVITADMNEFSPPGNYDRVVSVEMFEHMRNQRALLNRIHQWLHDNGKLLVHIFCHQTTPYLFEIKDEADWMSKYFFSGGMMPSVDLLPACGSRMHLDQRWIWNGRHYAKTCRAWLRRQDEERDKILQQFATTYGQEHALLWFHRWRMFFMACEELFAYNSGNEWFVAHYLFRKED